MRGQMVEVGYVFFARIVSVALAAVLLAACGAPVEDNVALSGDIGTFLESRGGDRPFEDFTDWDWDEVYVFDLESSSTDSINSAVGQDVASGWSTSGGLFVYFVDRKVVRVETMSVGAMCTAAYTTGAVVSRKYGCWLQDENARKLKV